MILRLTSTRLVQRAALVAATALTTALSAGLVAVPTASAASPAHCAGSCGGPAVVAPLSQEPPAVGACTSPEPVVCEIRRSTPDERVEQRDIRMRYLDLIGDMDHVRCTMRAEGRSPEEIARRLVDMRNDAKEITRAGMTPEEVRVLEARNMVKYGNPLGPTADQLHAKYGSWEKVADAATRTSRAVDGELGLAYLPCPCDVPAAA
ncbi:hypothetical protein OG785_44455 [Streptomyces sp. NBC_00006]|uniref:hypothetical protein n=1 Tax=unclassified Streptomyces TaxID=2593676 RepID=UPI0022527B3F|nr:MULTISPECIES: hypothetical protein [unclassified Streptomyces]MCX4835180.1 hypothetical protein [Streptomyces sp. NBC_01016]MCX5537609.1 hypothetical protein [Streptomyces sp. NBC_00006]